MIKITLEYDKINNINNNKFKYYNVKIDVISKYITDNNLQWKNDYIVFFPPNTTDTICRNYHFKDVTHEKLIQILLL